MKVLSFFAALLVTGSAFGSDFRGHHWGDSMLFVVETHGRPVLQAPGLLVYERRLGGEDALVRFVFGDHGLTEGGYFLRSGPERAMETLRSFEILNSLLNHRYGHGHAESLRLGKRMIAGSEEQRALAVASGELQLLNRWQAGSAEFSHLLRGQRYELLDHGFVYRRPEAV